jgi:L-fucose isomerase
MGMFEQRVWGPYNSKRTRDKLGVFVRAAAARHRLRGQVYGQIGGRSIGMVTGVSSSPAEWLRVFGVDIDHIDQSEILRVAETIGGAERKRVVAWLERNLRSVQYGKDEKLTRTTLEYQAACAAAVKRIIDSRQFDFVGIKCHYDLSEYYCTQCLSAAFLPSTRDWDGDREPVACACEADGDGALTMQILQLLSGMPSLFVDLRHFDTATKLWTLCNCGGQSVYYARRSGKPKENLASVDLVPVIPKYGGVGAHVRYVGREGPLTLARVVHDTKGPRLVGARARAVKAKESWLAKSCPNWPHLFVTIDTDPHELLANLHANHVHAVGGDWLEELRMFASMVGIPFAEL